MIQHIALPDYSLHPYITISTGQAFVSVCAEVRSSARWVRARAKLRSSVQYNGSLADIISRKFNDLFLQSAYHGLNVCSPHVLRDHDAAPPIHPLTFV